MSKKWDDALEDQLRLLWPTHTGSQIAARMKLSRSAILGKAKRLGLLGADKTLETPVKQDHSKRRAARSAKRSPRPIAAPIPEPKIAPVGETGISILDVTYGQCRAIIGYDGAPHHLARFCGQPIEFGNGFSFCAKHHEIYTVKGVRHASANTSYRPNTTR